MEFRELDLPGILLARPQRHGDARGYFVEIYRRDLLVGAGVEVEFVQDNLAYSAEAGVIRGLHFQKPPQAQAKLVRCARGAILDVCLDIRRGSPTYGRHIRVELTAENGFLLYVPTGFAHGYCTLEPNTEIEYKVTSYYAPKAEGGVAFDDPTLGDIWPIDVGAATVADRDRRWPAFAQLGEVFRYEGAP